jgi:hypothetical protein
MPIPVPPSRPLRVLKSESSWSEALRKEKPLKRIRGGRHQS